MSDLIKRAQVLATSALTWLTIISVLLVSAAQSLEGVAGVPPVVTQWIAKAVVIVGVAVAMVRRVTPVHDSQKGLLPPKGPAVVVAPAPAAQVGAGGAGGVRLPIDPRYGAGGGGVINPGDANLGGGGDAGLSLVEVLLVIVLIVILLAAVGVIHFRG